MTKAEIYKDPSPIGAWAREVVRFDRFYAGRLQDSAVAARVHEASRAELAILRELLQNPATPGWLARRLGLDSGYLSRVLEKLRLEELVVICRDTRDSRQREVSLTGRGVVIAKRLEKFEVDAVKKVLQDLPPRQQRRLVAAMRVITEIFERDPLTNFLESHGLR